MAIKRALGTAVCMATLLVITTILFSQPTVPGIDQPYGGDRNVTGQGVPNSGPLTVYDVSSGTKIYLGSGKSIDQQGYYAVAVNPPLVPGHKIVVVDSQGRSSVTTSVGTKLGPAGPSH
jgi:hypothetical protein